MSATADPGSGPGGPEESGSGETGLEPVEPFGAVLGAALGAAAGGESPADDYAGSDRTPREHDLWARLREDPNDVTAFTELAQILSRRGAATISGAPASGPITFTDGGEEGSDEAVGPAQVGAKARQDAEWSLAEELAHDARAWFPLIELARLSVHRDREGALRRLTTAAERDPSGRALAAALAMLRDEKMHDEALGLGVSAWRPREHDLEAGRHLVLAAVEAGRVADARRHLESLSAHPDGERARSLADELAALVAQLEQERRRGAVLTDPSGISTDGPLIDLTATDTPVSGSA